MAFPEQPAKIGTNWDNVMSQLKDLHRKLDIKNNMTSEVSVMKCVFLQKPTQVILKRYLYELSSSLKKSSALSNEIRNEGNTIFKKNLNMYESAFLYTLAIKCAEHDIELAYSHANRAAALMKIGFEKVAMMDCKMAVSHGHPDLFKVYERMCMLSKNSYSMMKANFTELERYLKKGSRQSLEIVQHYRGHLKELEKKCASQAIELPIDQKPDDDPRERMKLLSSPTSGRYTVTERSISRKEKIISECPFAFVPVHNYSVTKKYVNVDCENCGAINCFPFLCYECRMAVYCSPSCMNEQMKIHKYECEGYKKNLWFEIGIAHLSMRTMLVGLDSLLETIDDFDESEFKDKPEAIFNFLMEICDKDYGDYFAPDHVMDDFHSYALVLGLQSNLFQDNKFLTKNMLYANTANMLTMYLKDYTSFFEDIMETTEILCKITDWYLLIGAILMRHMGQLVCNGHAIIDFRQNLFTTESLPQLMLKRNHPNGGGLHLLLKSQRLFTGIFPRISMLNHSCLPNIRNSFEGLCLTIYPLDNMEAETELLNCYGPNSKLMSFAERQSSLKSQYNFHCQCVKCVAKDDEFRYNNSVLCRTCSKRLFYPNIITNDDDDDEEDRNSYVLKCFDCNKVHENEAMKHFFGQLVQANPANDNNITMDEVYGNYKKAVKDFGPLDEIRFHMTEMILHTLVTNRDAIKSFNAVIPISLAEELLYVKEKLYGFYSLEYVEASLFYLDVVSIVSTLITDKVLRFNIADMLLKIERSLVVCSKATRTIIQNYIDLYCKLTKR